MHSSPSLAAAVISVSLAILSCSDSSDAHDDNTPATTPSDAATKPVVTSPSKDAAPTAENMTQVGAPPQRPGTPKMPMNTGMDEDAAAPAGSAPKAADAGPAKVDTTSCMTDSDCKTFDSMCGSCRCLVMSKQAEPPGCGEPEVMCVIAPCLNKRAVCNSSKCALKDVSPNSS